jgi:hypothetical protein
MDTPNPKSEFEHLASGYCDGALNSREYQRLQELIREHAELRHRFHQMVSLHADLIWAKGRRHEFLSAPPVRTPVLRVIGAMASPLGRPDVWSVLAVGVLFAAYVVVISWNMLGNEAKHWKLEARGGGRPQASDDQPAYISASDQAKWQKQPQASLTAASDAETPAIARGESLELASGIVQLKLKQGVTLVIEGPAAWTIDGANHATLNRGKLVANVPQQAIGFALTTPTSQIVDLGTRFGVRVTEEGLTETQVFKEQVVVHWTGSQAPTLAHVSARQSQRLAAGEAARVDATSGIAPAVPFAATSDRFMQSFAVADAASAARPVVQIEPPTTELKLRGQPRLLFSDNFSVQKESHQLDPGPNDAPGRQSGLLAPLKYLVNEGDITATARLGDSRAPESLLFVGDFNQNRTSVSPAIDFLQDNGAGGGYCVSLTLSPGRSLDDRDTPTTLWAGVYVGAQHLGSGTQSPPGGIGFLVRDDGRYTLTEKHVLRREGQLAPPLAGDGATGSYRINIELQAQAFDGLTPGWLKITVNNQPVFEGPTWSGFTSSPVVLDFMHGVDAYHLFDDLTVSYTPLMPKQP